MDGTVLEKAQLLLILDDKVRVSIIYLPLFFVLKIVQRFSGSLLFNNAITC